MATLPRDDLLNQPLGNQVGVVPAQRLEAPAHALDRIHVPVFEHWLHKSQQRPSLGGKSRRPLRALGPKVYGDADGSAHPAVLVLTPGGDQIQGGFKISYQRRAGYSLAQDVGRIPDLRGDDKGPATGQGTLQVTVQLLSQGAADNNPTALGPLVSQLLQKGDSLRQRTGTDRLADAVQQAEGGALGENRGQEGMRPFRLSTLHERIHLYA